MACCHVAHDCQLGNHIIIANGTLLAGHVHVHDYASLSGRRGRPPFRHHRQLQLRGRAERRPPRRAARTCWSRAIPARPRCINAVGLKRNNFSPQVIQALAEAHRLLYRSKVGLENAWEILRANGQLVPQVNHLLSFVQGQHEGQHGRGRERRKAA